MSNNYDDLVKRIDELEEKNKTLIKENENIKSKMLEIEEDYCNVCGQLDFVSKELEDLQDDYFDLLSYTDV